jgi:hypothetical protein
MDLNPNHRPYTMHGNYSIPVYHWHRALFSGSFSMIILQRKCSLLTVQGIDGERIMTELRIPQPNPKQQERLNAKPKSAMTTQKKPPGNDEEETPEE